MNFYEFLLFQGLFALAIMASEVLVLPRRFLQLNRYWLLVLPILCALVWVPLPQSLSSVSQAIVLPEFSTDAFPQIQAQKGSLMWLILSFYFGVSFYLFLSSWLKTRKLKHWGVPASDIRSSYAVRYIYDQPTQSFGKTIYLNSKDKDEPWIIQHEEAHLRQKHSYDLWWVHLIWSLTWINPLAWRWRVLVRQNHEYLADEAVLNLQSTEKNDYIRLLLDKAFDTRHFSVGSYFSWNSLTFKRIKMINQNNKKSPLKLGLGLSVLLMALLALVACTAETQTVPEPEPQKQETTYKVVDQMPEFEGGNQALYSYLGTEIVYPEECKKENIEGLVVVSFVIASNGEIEQVALAKGAHELLDKEALRVISTMPKWVPGMHQGESVAVEYKLPIRFAMPEEG